MKCTIPGINVKVFGRAIHSLAKIGEELYVEPLPNGLALRTVNTSRSAYGCFMFAPAFFTKYVEVVKTDDSQEDSVVRCRILMKSCLSVFKSLATLERTVDNCKILLNSQDSVMRFQLHCRHGIVKTYNLSFIECETLQAVYSKDLSPNVLTAQSRLLCDVVTNFQPSQEEVTLCLTPEKVAMKNHVDDEPDPNKVMRTEMSLVPDEFETFQAGVDTEVTFCLKELRAILAFSESSNLPVTIRFQSAGTPIVFSLDSEATYEANFVLATLAANQGVGDNMTSHDQTTPHISNRSTAASSKSTTAKTGRKHRLYNGAATRHGADASLVPTTSRGLSSETRTRDESSRRSVAECTGPPLHDLKDDTMLHLGSGTGVTVTQETGVGAGNVGSSVHCGDGDSRLKPLAPLLLESEDDDNEMLPATPPSKKFKSLFFGASQPSQPPPVTVGKVLVADSDDEG